MRTALLLAAGLGLCACRASDTYDVRSMPAFAEASFQPERPTLRLTAGLDPVVAQLLRAMESAYSEERRVIMQNIANVNSVGYSRRIVETSIENVTGSDGMTFHLPIVKRVASVFSPGTLEITERQLDVAIDGTGFLSVIRADGSTGYTRNGNLHLNIDQQLVTADGLVVTPVLTVPEDTPVLYISPDGTVSGRRASSPDSTTNYGQLNLHRFARPTGLLLDRGTFRATRESGQPTTGAPGSNSLGELKQGFLERSNVQMQRELMRLRQLEQQHQSVTSVLAHFGMLAP